MPRVPPREPAEARGQGPSEAPRAEPSIGHSSNPPIWKPDEAGKDPAAARGDELARESSPARSLWRPDEGPADSAPQSVVDVAPPTSSPRSVWRDDEGTAKKTGTQPGPPSGPSRREDQPSSRDVAFQKARWRRVGRVAAIVVLVVFVIFVGDLVYATVGLNSALNDVKASLETGRTNLRDGKVDASESSFASASRSADRAESLVGHPAWSVLTYLPLVGRDGRAVEAILEAGDLSARAGQAAAQAGAVLGLDRRGLANSIYRRGTVRFDTLDAGMPFVARAADLLDQSQEVLSEAPAPSLGFVGEKLTAAQSALSSASESAGHARALLNALPSLLGRTSPRSYLLGFQALGEARGTGGVMGVYGILHADGGKLRLGRIAPYRETFPYKFEAVGGPRWFKRSYRTQLALRQWPQANLSPNFPAVSRVLLNMYETQTGKRLDGVFALDPVALAHLMRGIDPLRVPELDEPITSENVERILLHDSYVDFPDREEQDRFLKHVVKKFWKKVSDGDVNGPEFVAGLGDAARTQHVKIFSRSKKDQETLSDLGIDGSYDDVGPNIQLMYGNSNLASKVDYYLTRSIDTTVQLNSSGSARVRTVVRLKNSAPSGPPSLFLGPVTQDHPPGLNRSLLNFLLPLNSKINELEIDGRSKLPFRMREEDHPVFWNVVDIPSGDSTKVAIDYSFEGGATISDDGGHFNFTLFPQTTLNPDAYSITVAPPAGYIATPDDKSTLLPSGFVRRAGTLDEPVELSVTLERT